MPFQLVLNYRRGDAAGNAGRLRDALVARFGEDNVFMDIDTIEPGVDFVEAIERAVGSCDVFLALIGQQWLTSANQSGLRRLDDPEDFVRLEIEAALRRGIRVIPVLVQDVEMPTADQLPESLARFARRNAIEIRDSTWRYDADRLIETLTKIEQQQPIEPGEPGAAGPPADGPSRPEFDRRVLLAAAVVALLIGAALFALFLLRDGDDELPPRGGDASSDRIAFAANGSIFTVGHGEDPVELTHGRGDKSPDWSPNGKEIAIVRSGDIWVVDASGGDGRPLTEDGVNGAPDWSPDGNKIAFDRRVGESTTYDVWVMNANGTDETNLMQPDAESGGAPDWSPDGKRIVFQHKTAIWTMNANGSAQRQLPIEHRGPKHQPAWSPNGVEIAFALFTATSNSHIYVVDADGGLPTPLTAGPTVDRRNFPAWSGDGDRIAFAAEDSGIWTIDRNSGAPALLVQRTKLETPSWRPPRG